MNINNYRKVQDYEVFGELNLIEDDIEILKADTEISEEDRKEILEDYEQYLNKNIRVTWAIKDNFCGVIFVNNDDIIIDRISY